MRPTLFDFATHSFSLMSRNWFELLQISAIRILIYAIVLAALDVAFWSSPLFDGLGFILYGVLSFCVDMVFVAWLAVPWHRYVLLSEPSSWRISAPNRATLSYAFWALILIIGAFLPLIILAPFEPLSQGIPVIVGMVAVGLLIFGIYAGFRLSIILPAIALERPLGLAEAWRLTKPHRAVIAGVLILIFGVLLMVGWIGFLLESIHPIMLVVGAPLSWLSILFDISILTTLYGHIVEDRPLE